MPAPQLHLVAETRATTGSKSRKNAKSSGKGAPGGTPAAKAKKPTARRPRTKEKVTVKGNALPVAAAGATKKASKAPAKREALAADLMRTPAICCNQTDSLNEAARLMWEHDLGSLTVINQAQEPVGMITDRDACMAAYTQGVALYHGAVASAMSQAIVSCQVDTSIAKVRELMTTAQVRRLPVVDAQGKLVGVVGISDILKDAQSALPKNRKRGSSAAMVAQLFDAIYAQSAV